jgi:hypothetical protein
MAVAAPIIAPTNTETMMGFQSPFQRAVLLKLVSRMYATMATITLILLMQLIEADVAF